MINAFLRLTTVEDLVDLIALLKRGAVVGYEPVEGSIWGPCQPCKFESGDILSEGIVSDTEGRDRVFRMAPADLETFLVRYLDEGRPFRRLRIVPCDDLEAIRTVWRVLNEYGGRALDKAGLIKLVQVLADHYGGTVEPQVAYGAPGWVEAVKTGKAWVTLWHTPSEPEMHELAQYGAKGLINGVEAERRRSWYVGMSGPYLMPHRGFIESDAANTPQAAWEASGRPTGLGRTWDRIREKYRLCGVQVDPEATDAEWRTVGWEVRRAASGKGMPPWDHPVRPNLVMARDAVSILLIRDGWLRVDFEDQGAA